MKNNPAFLAALFGMCLAVPAHGGVVGVDVNGTVSSSGVLDPATRTWTAIGTPFALDGMTVGSSISASSLGSIGSPGLPIFANYRHNGASGAITVTLTGLDDSQTYKLAVMMSQDGFGIRGGTATVTTAGATNPPAESTDPTDLSTFAEGNNYVLFEGLTTGTTPGQITFTVTNGSDGIGILNGFEIQNVDPTTPGIRVPDSVTASSHGEPVSLAVTVNNTAGSAYHVTGISFSGADAAQFSDTTATTPLEVPAGGSAEVHVDFTPTTGGTANATLTLATDDPGVPNVEVPLVVEVHDPAVSAATSLAFGSFIVPPGPTPATIDVENLGFTSELTLSNPQITGTGAAAFSVTNLPASIDAGGFEQIEVTFNPAAPGVYQAQLTLDTNDTYNPTVTINLSGMVYGGGMPKMQWGFDYTSGTVQANGATVNDDTGSSNPGLLVAPGCETGGTYTADIPAAGTAVGQAQLVTGVGSLDVTGPGGVSTGSGAFSGQALNGLSAAAIEAAGGLTYEIWVKNASATVGGNLIGLGGMHGLGVRPTAGIGFYYGDNSEFLAPATPIDTTEWTHVAAVMVAKPGTGAMQFSKITLYVNGQRVAEDADGRTFPWFLQRAAGIGIHPVLGGDDADGLLYEPRISAGTLTPSEFTVVPPPAGIVAPDVVAGTTNGSPLGLTIEVENTDTTGRTLTAPTFSGPDAAFFTVTDFPATLTPGERGPVLVDFDAVASGGGTFTATMTVHSDDPNRPAHEVTLTVVVYDPELVLSSSNLDFGQLTGPGTDTRSILVVNDGANLDLTLSNPLISGVGAAAYSVTLPGPIAPGDSGEIEVTFQLGTVGNFPAQLTFDTNDSFHPTATVDLAGGVGTGYASWADQWVDGQAADLDYDNDGVANGVEYFMGNTTSGFTANPPIGSDRTISWPKGANYTGTYGTDYHLETSATLGTWDPVDEADVVIDADSIGFTVPIDGPRKFVRLVVTGP